ncbi:MAG: valine--tRNA ligase [bacterium]|nr:valine--tRNA ligase [bacterium]
MEKAYEPKDIEAKWYSFWEKEGYFVADNQRERPYSIVIPPPNVTGSLHIGHALNNTIQDILIRWRRMQGYSVLWVPGTDHAGIATQNVVEKELLKKSKTRESLQREAFVEMVWQWKEEYGGKIIEQLKRLGCSCDWSKLRFTMDEGLSRAVREVFVRLYKEGLIYQGDYIINWCPRCKTAISDIETDYRQETGYLYHLKYPIKDSTKFILVATTRPETMLGDTAVAVNPEDARYKNLIGKVAILPILGREIPIITDRFVDLEFGTGAVKVTPAHDANDFEIGKRHSLQSINILNPDATMNENAGHYSGLDRFAARDQLVEELKNKGLVEKIEDYLYNITRCYRCHTIIEPYLSKQWFVKMKPLAEPAIEAVKLGRCQFVPKSWEKTYFEWMENIKDWCISRQIWWGHRIPVWYCKDCGEKIVEVKDPDRCSCGSSSIYQDEDVLDTWFSSSLWPFSTMGWPEETEDLKKFYPTSVLSTGFDIIFFWVARMMMMGLKFRQDVPFHQVYIHGLIRSEDGAKMSKSSGNIIDPLIIIEKYGCDSLRFTLAVLSGLGRDVILSEERIEGYRHFMNKLWNAERFILMNLEDYDGKEYEPKTLGQRWIASCLSKTIKELTNHLEEFSFNLATGCTYEFVWHKYCDWYLEIAKLELADPTERKRTQHLLVKSLDMILRLLHPFIPFITEELWQKLPNNSGSIMTKDWPIAFFPADTKADEEMELIQSIIGGIRNIRSTFKIPPKEKLEVMVKSDSAALKNYAEYIMALAGLATITINPETKRPPQSVVSVSSGIEVYVLLSGLIDIDEEKKRITKRLSEVEEKLEKTKKKIENSDFIQKAPQEVIEKERKKEEDLIAEKEKLIGLTEMLIWEREKGDATFLERPKTLIKLSEPGH